MSIRMRKCAFRLDDITPDMNWENFETVRKLFEKYRMYPLLGIVPDNQDAHLRADVYREDFWEQMLALKRMGWSIAQHGYCHVYETEHAGLLGINPFSEFAGLPYEIQYEKLKKGKEILRAHELETDIFMAPGHTYDDNTLKALARNGFHIVTDGYSTKPYRMKGLTFIPSRMSGPGRIQGIDTVCLHLNGMDRKQLEQLEEFIEQNRAVLCSYSELLVGRPVRNKTVAIALQERKSLFVRRIKNGAAGSQALQNYLQKSNAASKWKKLWKRMIMLPLLPYYVLTDGKQDRYSG